MEKKTQNQWNKDKIWKPSKYKTTACQIWTGQSYLFPIFFLQTLQIFSSVITHLTCWWKIRSSCTWNQMTGTRTLNRLSPAQSLDYKGTKPPSRTLCRLPFHHSAQIYSVTDGGVWTLLLWRKNAQEIKLWTWFEVSISASVSTAPVYLTLWIGDHFSSTCQMWTSWLILK